MSITLNGRPADDHETGHPAREPNGWLRRDNGTTWPDPSDPLEVEWKLRYGTPERSDLLWAASVIGAYKHLMEGQQR
jgi:hypothetical protein